MASANFSEALSRAPRTALRLRAPWRRDVWSPAEVAVALQSQRAELLATISRRGDARGLAASALEETVNDAICIVVMMGRPILSEQHLMGAFWATARILLRQHHEGRHSLRVGSRSRVELEVLGDRIEADDLNPEEVLALKDRLARAADFAAQLSDLERDVVAVMAVRSAGLKTTARLLGLPVAEVKAAHRSAQLKLDRVAIIAAAGRMCSYRERAITAYSQEQASEHEVHLAEVHLAACTSCRAAYVQLVREMRSNAFQRGTAAALLPAPMLALDHRLGLLDRLLAWAADPPRIGTGRVFEALGGAGVVKAVAAGSAVVLATATLATNAINTTASKRQSQHHHRAHITAWRPAAGDRPPSVGTATVSPRAQTSPQALKHKSDRPVLTQREHAELEFSSLRSPRSHSTSYPRKRVRTSAARATASEGSSSSGTEAPTHEAAPKESSVQNGPSAAAREFGQP
jgi:hypothetical protein